MTYELGILAIAGIYKLNVLLKYLYKIIWILFTVYDINLKIECLIYIHVGLDLI